jgi:uncharacterized protein (DUF433 family)
MFIVLMPTAYALSGTLLVADASRMWDDLPMNNALHAITSDPQRRGGRPCIRDLRISVGDVLGWLAQGQTPEEIVAEYPELTTDDIRASLEYAAARESHEVRLATAA